MKLFKKWREKRRRRKLLNSLQVNENGNFIYDFEEGGDLTIEDVKFMDEFMTELARRIEEERKDNEKWE